MENKEIRILLTEKTFTDLCKKGFLTYNSVYRNEIYMTKIDIKDLSTGKIITKDGDEVVVKIALQDIGLELIREIIRRSPIYSELAYEI